MPWRFSFPSANPHAPGLPQPSHSQFNVYNLLGHVMYRGCAIDEFAAECQTELDHTNLQDCNDRLRSYGH